MTATRTCASKIVLARSLPMRKESVGTPFMGEMHAWREKTSCPVVCEKRAKMIPVASAVMMSPTTDSATTSKCAAVDVGYIAP